MLVGTVPWLLFGRYSLLDLKTLCGRAVGHCPVSMVHCMINHCSECLVRSSSPQ
jgi:hypothetical protein